MEFLNVFAVLWRRRIAVALGVPVAALVGLLLVGALPFGPGSGASPGRGVAEARVMLDHHKPILADLSAVSDTLGTQAALLAEVMAGDDQRNVIAQRAGVPPSELLIHRPQVAQLFAPGLLAQRAGDAVAGLPAPSVISVAAASPLPVLTIDVSAPSELTARRIASAARDTLEEVMATRAPTVGRSLVVRPLGSVRSVAMPGSQRSRLIGVAGALFIFIFWTCSVVVLHGVLRVWRRATEPSGAAAAA
ncbi:MAG TPA: hypothetical protein VGC59_08350 [Solirubrobacteraceae bacterium]|jgi:hypothetical protein